MPMIAYGHNGHNHWRKRIVDGKTITECSDDRETWQPGEVTEAGAKKRDAALAPVPRAATPAARAERIAWKFLLLLGAADVLSTVEYGVLAQHVPAWLFAQMTAAAAIVIGAAIFGRGK